MRYFIVWFLNEHIIQISGSPLSAAKRLQFNLEIVPIDIMDQMQKIKPVILPLFWIEEGVQLNSTYTNQLKYQLFL
jgi:scavenger receptor class B, member 1